MAARFTPGTPVIYHKTKRSPTPGPRAADVQPTPHGDEYVYVVEKFWVVREVREDGQLILRTRRGKEHVVSPTDPQLRPMHWWEKLIWRNRIPDPNAPAEPDSQSR